MVKHNQTACLLLPTKRLRAFDHFVGLVLKGLNDLEIFCSNIDLKSLVNELKKT